MYLELLEDTRLVAVFCVKYIYVGDLSLVHMHEVSRLRFSMSNSVYSAFYLLYFKLLNDIRNLS